MQMSDNQEYLPFNGQGDEEILEAVQNDALEFEEDKDADPPLILTDAAKDFISKLLERDVTKRLSAQEALSHEWL